MQKLKFSFIFSILAFTLFGQGQFVDTTAKLAAKAQIEKYRDRVIKGEKMADLARLYSQDPGSSGEGGLYRNVKKGLMDPVFEAVAFSLKQGQISNVFETAYGYHFIQLVQRKGDLLDLRHILIVPKEQK
jgi:peptidyl-prolyl cis-trans isomerase SurA